MTTENPDVVTFPFEVDRAFTPEELNDPGHLPHDPMPFDDEEDEDEKPAISDPEQLLKNDIGDVSGAHEPKATRSRKAKAE